MVKHKRPPYTRDYTDRHGKHRIYFNKSGMPNVALRAPMYSEAFWTDYHNAMAGAVTDKSEGAGAAKTVGGTFNALIAQFYQSVSFVTSADATKRSYRSTLEQFRKEYGDLKVATLKTQHVDQILGKIAERSPSQASNTRKRLFQLMALAVKWGYRSDNPMLTADRVKHKAKGYRTMTEADIDLFRSHWPTQSPQRQAFEILLYTGLRRKDAVHLGRQHIQGGEIVTRTSKSGGQVEIRIPIHPDFRSVLDSITHGHLNLIVTVHGAARSDKAFTDWFSEAGKAAGITLQCSPHTMRKAACRRLAEAGCTPWEIMSITGHRDLDEVERYCRDANKTLLSNSAIAKLHKGS